MGVVWLAHAVSDGTPVALKTIRPASAGSEAAVERFLREASILRKLDHPHIVRFREVGHAYGQLYFVTDYVQGTDAARLLAGRGPWPIPVAVRLARQVLEALEYAHAQGFVHRDIKPENLLITKVDGRLHTRLADFGLARLYKSSTLSGLTLMGEAGGTVRYMPPEQVIRFREAKPPADLYSLAATLYTLLTGKPIYDFPKRQDQQLLMILHDEPVPIWQRRADVPEPLAALIRRALAKKPEDRPPDARAFRKALAPFEKK
jgi:serine/threonine-protein kinase